MSYDQTYKGTFTYADAHCLEAAIDAYMKREPDDDEAPSLELDDLKVDKLTISIDWDGSAPASCWYGNLAVLRALGEYALGGSVKATFTLDGTDREQASARKRRSSAGLPPRHHRWDVYAAAKAGDGKRLRALAAGGVSLDVTFPEIHESPLHLAARAGSAAAVDALLAAGVAVDTLVKGTSALHRATSAAVVERLLAAGAEKDRVNDRGETPLAYAIERERFEAARALFEAGATLGNAKEAKKAKQGDERSMAVRACAQLAEAKQLELLRGLLDRGELGKAIEHPHVISRAIAGGEQVVIDFLLQHGAKLPADFLGQAVESGSLALVELALADPTARKQAGASSKREDAMVAAAFRGHLDVMRRLADAGVPVAPPKGGEFSPLHAAAVDSDGRGPAMIAFLLEHGAPIDLLDKGNMTPLAKAIWMSCFDNAKVLYLAGASVDAVNRKEVTDQEMATFWKKIGKAKPKASKATAPPAKATPKAKTKTKTKTRTKKR